MAFIRADKSTVVEQLVCSYVNVFCSSQYTSTVICHSCGLNRQATRVCCQDLALTVIQSGGLNGYSGVGGNGTVAVIYTVPMAEFKRLRSALAYLAFLVLQLFRGERDGVGCKQAAAVIMGAGCRDAELVIRDDLRAGGTDIAWSGIERNVFCLRQAAGSIEALSGGVYVTARRTQSMQLKFSAGVERYIAVAA